MGVVHLGFERKAISHPLDGIGCLVPKCEPGFSLLGSLWSSSLFSGRAPEGEVLMMNYLGGTRQPELLALPDQALIERSLVDLHRLLGVRAKPRFAHVLRHPRALPQYLLGHQLFLQEMEKHLPLLPGIFLAGNYLQGVSVRACISQGEQTAQRIAHLLSSHAERPALATSMVQSPEISGKSGSS
jgi:oxygen-dependent protoporphyrinogen oxidase